MSFFYFVFGGILRRWFGSEPDNIILSQRWLQHIFMAGTFMTIYVTNWQDLHSIIAGSLMTAWLQIQYWTRGHGATFYDMGRDENPDISRYDRWYKKPLDIFYEEDDRYKGSYDFWYHTMRYTCPMIPVAIVTMTWEYVLLGLASTVIYEFCLSLRERNIKVIGVTGTVLAEYMLGAVMFFGCYQLGWGI